MKVHQLAAPAKVLLHQAGSSHHCRNFNRWVVKGERDMDWLDCRGPVKLPHTSREWHIKKARCLRLRSLHSRIQEYRPVLPQRAVATFKKCLPGPETTDVAPEAAASSLPGASAVAPRELLLFCCFVAACRSSHRLCPSGLSAGRRQHVPHGVSATIVFADMAEVRYMEPAQTCFLSEHGPLRGLHAFSSFFSDWVAPDVWLDYLHFFLL